jgi:hypothetical protein
MLVDRPAGEKACIWIGLLVETRASGKAYWWTILEVLGLLVVGLLVDRNAW